MLSMSEIFTSLVDSSEATEVMMRNWRTYLPHVVKLVDAHPEIIQLVNVDPEDVPNMQIKQFITKVVDTRALSASALGPTGASIAIDVLESLKAEPQVLNLPESVAKTLISAAQRVLAPVAAKQVEGRTFDSAGVQSHSHIRLSSFAKE